VRSHLRIELSALANASAPLGNLSSFPIEVQAELLLESYRGTTDWEDGATLQDAISEIESTFKGDKGEFVSEASGLLVNDEGLSVSAIYSSIFEGEPFIVYVFTRPGSLGQGLATSLIKSSAALFQSKGYDTLHLFVTDANPAKNLYERLGFTKVPI
jgi:ribosomal protein S18 acetylase RimI-like enzyme